MRQIFERLIPLSVRVVVAALVLVAVGCTAAGPESDATGGAMAGDDMAAMPTVTPGEVTVVNVRSNATAPGAANGSAYLTILNGTDETVHLVSVASDVAEAVELHETTNDNGVMRMAAQPQGFEIAPGESLMLEPGGKHVMLLGLNESLAAGESYDLTLNFEGMDPMPFSVPVLEIGVQTMEHGDMEHENTDDDGMDDEGTEHDDAMMEPPAWATEFDALDVSALHHIDDSLNITGTLDTEFAETVQTFQTGLTAIEWPDELTEQVNALDAALTELDAALQAEDMEAAAPLATDVHEVAHELQHSIESQLSGDEHGEDEAGAHEHEDDDAESGE